MISLKRFLNDESETIASYERITHLLLQALALHAVEGDPVVRDSFRAKINDIESKLAGDRSPAHALTLTGNAITALQEYNRRTSKFIHAQEGELQSMIGMLTQAMTQIFSSSQTSIKQLQELQKEIEQARLLEDIRALKTQLADCLVTIRLETVRQQAESARAVKELDQAIRQVRKKPEGGFDPDSLSLESDRATGLLGRNEAETDLRNACEAAARVYAGFFIVDRMNAISSRFGNALADQVLAFFGQHLRNGLTPEDRVYRWEHGSFLALMPRQEEADFVRKQLSRILSRRLDHTFEIESRSVAVPIASTWTIVPLYELSHSQVLQKIKVFTAGAAG